ncbi:MAG: hypothetical protein JJE17_03025 [Peptostreptococcaceae bacterium]|nr:hypothetical protein [Peptostreptococcaceae bacterium]
MNKSHIENNYYIYVANELVDNGSIKLECTKQQYDQVVIDELLQYHIAYEYNSHSPDEGNLSLFNPNETIDNRQNR